MKKINVKWVWICLSIILIVAGLLTVYYVFLNKKVVSPQQTQVVKKQLWTCTMHPQVISDRPGQCPICQMDLVKKTDDDNQNTEDMSKMIKLSNNKLILANVSTVKVKKEEMIKTIKAYSYLDIADQNRKIIAAKFNGRIEKLFVNKTGDNIKAGEKLFEVYSPDLVQVQNDFLLALDGKNDMKTALKLTKKKLYLYGFTESQINNLEKTREVKLTVEYYSPIGGIVMEKKVQEGMYFNEGMTLYEVADLSMLWNISEIYEQDLDIISEGKKVNLSLQAYPGEVFEGRVTFINPVLNPQTRTVKVRSEFSNVKGKLKPQMYGETTFEHNFAQGLLVPSDAILFMGKRNVVWLKVSDSMFEPREVMVGMKINDKYQIISGINEDDEIAITGGYLIDSESQLKSGMAIGHQHEGAQSNSTPKEKNMDGMKESIIRKGIIDLEKIDINKDGKVYQDSMDWNVISDNDDICPICNMKLEKVTLKEAKKNLIKHGFNTK